MAQLYNIVRLYWPGCGQMPKQRGDNPLCFCFEPSDKNPLISVDSNGLVVINNTEFCCQAVLSRDPREYIRLMAANLYRALVAYTGQDMPWGSLTGIRPTKPLYELLGGYDFGNEDVPAALETMKERYLVSDTKLRLLRDIIATQKGLVVPKSLKPINRYINIPICPTRCNYCSFISHTVSECKGLIDSYVGVLKRELTMDTGILNKLGYSIHTIYVGGGTPTVLSAGQLDDLLGAVPKIGVEWTVEAGRADTIDDEKLSVLKSHGVTRICINPQSMSDATLRAIGRGHTATDIVRAYDIAKKYDFVVNMDIIAGLDGETEADFLYSLGRVLDLKPHNITIHAKSNKRASKGGGDTPIDAAAADKMMDNVAMLMRDNGYNPYYVYRQKSQLGALENVGYSRPGYECISNITTMEESLGVIACGAGAISKVISYESNRIERYANCKEIGMYIEEFGRRYNEKVKVLEQGQSFG